MAALCTLSNKKGLIEKLCVAHDQDVGVYGFVFYRDGEWISEIVDDFVRPPLPCPYHTNTDTDTDTDMASYISPNHTTARTASTASPSPISRT